MRTNSSAPPAKGVASRTVGEPGTAKEADSRRGDRAEAPAPPDPKPNGDRLIISRSEKEDDVTSRFLPELKTISSYELLRWMFSFLRPVVGLCIYACLLLSAWVGTEVMVNREMGAAVDQIKHLTDVTISNVGFWHWIAGHTAEAIGLRIILGWIAVLVLGMAVLRYLRELANVKLSMTMVYYLRQAVYDKLQRVGFGFHDVISTGQLINRALSDLQNVRTFVQTAVLTSLEIVLVVGGYEVLLLTKNATIALLALAPIPLWVWYILRFSKKIQPAQKAVMEADDRNVSLITENIAGVHVVKAFATEKQEIARYNANLETFIGRVLGRVRLYANFTPVIRGIASASHLSLYLIAAIFIIQGKLMIGDLLVLGAAMNSILGRLQQVSAINEQYQNAIVSARRLYEVLMAPATVPQHDSPLEMPKGPGTVRFEKVGFGYDPAKPVLRDISFEAKGGAIVAIVGPTGAGKTTLVNLIARFYDPQQGSITIDGVDVRKINLDSLRRNVAFVFQETYLFSDTVAANIAYGRPHVLERARKAAVSRMVTNEVAPSPGAAPPAGSPEMPSPTAFTARQNEVAEDALGEVEAASRLAQAHEFIETLPKGYNTMLGERGASLSGGQRQRLAIARAILSDPRILVLDDATAAVDPETEDLIRRGMDFVMHGRTTFLIAHRVSTVKRADLVIVLENGQVTQMGTHAELMQQDGHYRQIAQVQLYGDTAEFEEEHPSHMDRVQDIRRVSADAIAAANNRSSPRPSEGEV